MNEATLQEANARRRRLGKKPLTSAQARRAVSDNSAFDIMSLLTTYTVLSSDYSSLPDNSNSIVVGGDGGTFGGGGASGSWD